MHFIRSLLALLALISAVPAAAQIQQSGTVTPGHGLAVVTDNVVQDAGPATAGKLTEIGITKNGGVALGVNSGPITGQYTQFGIGVTPGSGVQITDTSFGGAAHIPINFVMNGATVLTITDTGILINGSSVIGTVTSVNTGTGLTGGPITSTGTISLAPVANNTVLGNVSGISAAPVPITGGQLSTMMGLGTASTKAATSTGANVASTSGVFTAGHILTAADALGTVQDGGTVPTGTITQVLAGTGLSGGGSTGSVTVSLASPVAVSNGGTGATTLTNHAVVVGQAASAVAFATPGAAGTVLTSNGVSADPTFQAVSGTGTVTNVATGTGLTGGPITTTGTIAFASIANHDILSNISGGSAAPIANTLTATIDDAIGSTRGSLLERGASGWALLTPGTVNLPLVSGGAAADPSYAALGVAGGGTGNTSFSAHQALIATGTTTITGKTIPDCQDTTGQHLNYTQLTDTFACGTSGGLATPVSVANGGTGISSGTSGGVLAFTASGTIASSGALSASNPVIGGGAGVAPSSGSRSGNTTTFATTTGSLTSGHIATFDASGNIQDGGAAPTSGSLVLISTQTVSGASNIRWTGLGSTYNNYKLYCGSIKMSAADGVNLNYGTGGGPTWDTGTNYDNNVTVNNNGTVTQATNTATVGFRTSGGTSLASTADGSTFATTLDLTLFDIPSTSVQRAIWSALNGWAHTAGGQLLSVQGLGLWTNATTAITGIELVPGSGTISATCSLYGVAP